MSAKSIIKVFHDVLATPKEQATGVQVTSVVDQELPSDRDLIREVTTSLNGMMIDLHQLGLHGGNGSLEGHPDLQVALQQLIKPPTTPGELVYEPDGPTLKAGFAGVTVVNDSAPTVLGAALAPFMEGLLKSEVVSIVWDDDLLDVESSAAVWKALHLVQGRTHGALSRLFLFSGGKDSISLHFDSELPASCLIRGDAVHTAKRPSSLVQRVQYLAETQRQEQVMVLFLGAGFSATSGLPGSRIPLGDGVRDEALLSMFGDDGTQESRVRQFYEVVAENDLWTSTERATGPPGHQEFAASLTLERVLLVQFTTIGGPAHSPTLRQLRDRNDKAIQVPSHGVQRLHEILRLDHKIVIVTVNFDRLVEFPDDIAFDVIATTDDLDKCDERVKAYLDGPGKPGTAERPITVIKLHGTIEDYDSVIADVRRVADGLCEPVARALGEHLTHPDSPIPWVYVGHSLRDADLVKLLQQQKFATGTNEMWVSPTLPEPVTRFIAEHRDQAWSDKKADPPLMRHMTVSSDRFFIELRRAWPT